MPGIIEAQKRPALCARPVLQPECLGALHVRLEPAKKHHTGTCTGAPVIGQPTALWPVEILRVRHRILRIRNGAIMHAPSRRIKPDLSPGAQPPI